MIFLDTNVWYYAFVESEDPFKHERAKELITKESVSVSLQIIGEISNALIRKASINEPRIRDIIRSFFRNYNPVLLEEQDYLRASSLRELYRFSHWDSLVVAAALKSHSSILYSEDMQDGLVVEGSLRIVNPFKNAR